MNICMILDEFFPPDIRVEKETRSLLKEGHEIHLICRSEKSKNNEEVVAGIEVHRLSSLGKLVNKLCGFIYAISFIHLRWLVHVKSIVKKYSIEVLHVHDLPLALTTIVAGRLFKIPVIFDSHENWPAFIRLRNRKGLLFSAKRYDTLESISVSYADHVIVVVEEMKRKLIRKGGNAKKITVVSNTIDVIDKDRINSLLNVKSNNQYLISYCGGLAPHRGVELFIQAIPIILEELPNSKFLIVGNGMIRELHELATDLKIEKNVKIEGWGKWMLYEEYLTKRDCKNDKSFSHGVYSNFVKAMLQSTIGIIPHRSNPHCNATLPHKLFQHMYFKMPVLVSDVKPLKRIVEETNCGSIFSAGDSEDLSRKVIEMASNRELLKKMGERGHRAVITKYNWQNDAKRLLQIYRNFERLKKPV